MCSYDVWPSLLHSSALPLSSTLDDRLKYSLVGFTSVPQHNNGLMVLQMSSLGDLFYQPLIPKTTQQKYGTSSQTSLLCSNDISFCQEWIKDFIEMENESKKKQHFSRKKSTSETECSSEFLSMISLKTPHKLCSLCILHYNDFTEKEIDGLVCTCCGIDIMTGRQLQNAKNENIITTSKICSFGEPPHDLNIFPEEMKYQNSVSQGFQFNWVSEEPKPIELTNKRPQDEGNTYDDTNEMKTKVVKSELEHKAESSSKDHQTVDQTFKDISTTDNNVPIASKKFAMRTTEFTSNSENCVSKEANEEISQTLISSNSNFLSATNAIFSTMPRDSVIISMPTNVDMEKLQPVTTSKGNRSSPVKAKKKKLGQTMGF